MISRVHSFVLQGIEAVPCEIEVDVDTRPATPSMAILGLPDAAVRESSKRVWTAIQACGFFTATGRTVINLAPASLRKEGPVYDLPIAVALLIRSGVVTWRVNDLMMAAELALDGRLRPVRGAVSMAMLARQRGLRGVLVATGNAAEAAVVDGIDVLAADSLADVVALLNGNSDIEPAPRVDVAAMLGAARAPIDFGEVRGQEATKRALTIAAAGGHNVLMLGPAGTGKTMMARALPGILPPLTPDEALEVTRIYSSVGALARDRPLVTTRPVRTPHHTASAAAVIGGGSVPRPGDVSLAHRGILFLDEMPEFARHVLETLRQPLEDGVVTVSRTKGTARFPARFMLVAAMNPTHRGDADDVVAMKKYVGRISGPLIDRIDIHVEVPAVPYKQLRQRPTGSDTETLRAQVLAARVRQHRRQDVINGDLTGRMLDTHAALEEPGSLVLGQAMSEMGLSARAYDRIRRVARTIADLEGSDTVESHHVAEAVQYRLLDRIV